MGDSSGPRNRGRSSGARLFPSAMVDQSTPNRDSRSGPPLPAKALAGADAHDHAQPYVLFTLFTDFSAATGPEDSHTIHWLENGGPVPAVEISVDIVRQG
jgi:hypothetical protein